MHLTIVVWLLVNVFASQQQACKVVKVPLALQELYSISFAAVPTAWMLAKWPTSTSLGSHLFSRCLVAEQLAKVKVQTYGACSEAYNKAKMASLLKGLLGSQPADSQPTGAEIIQKLRNRYASR